MRYWKVSLLRDGRTAREWHVHAEVLTVGSNGANAVRLPPPVEPFALRLESAPEPADHEVGPYLLRVEDETLRRERLWSQAQERIEQVSLVCCEPAREAHSPARLALAAFALVGITNLAANLLVDDHRESSRAIRSRSVQTSTPANPVAFSADSAQHPLLVAAPAASPRMAAIAPAPLLDGQGAAPGSAVFAILAALAFLPRAGGRIWSSAPPPRYRAPWPDAPIPPH